MTVQEELESIIQEAKAYRWTPELFERCRALLPYANTFNVLRQNLLPDEYEQFDLMYCDHIRPQDKELNRWLRAELKKGGEEVKTERKEARKRNAGSKKPGYQFNGFPENW